MKVNHLISYQNTVDDMFFAAVSVPMMAPYQTIKKWMQWANGYVPDWHNEYHSTHLGRAIVQMLTNKIFDKGIKFEGNNKDTLGWLSDDYNESSGFDVALKRLLEYGQGSGTAALKADIDSTGNLIWTAVRQDRFGVIWSGNKIVNARFFLSVLSGTYNTQRLILVEERYYNSSFEPVYKYYMQIMNNSSTTNQWSIGNRIESLDQLTVETLSYIVHKLGNKKLGIEYPMNALGHLGVYIYENTATSSMFDGAHLGDSSLANAIELLAMYDKSYSLMINDIELARGQVLIPDDMIPKIANGTADPNDIYTHMSMYQEMLNQTFFKKIPYVNPEDQKPISVQFELRAQEWATSLNTQLQEIIVRVMASPSSIAPFLNDGSMKTATEINAIEHNTVNYINDKRSILKKIANSCIKDTLKYYKKEGRAFIMFAAVGLNNDQQASEKAIAEYNAGLRSKLSTIKACNPDWTTAEVQEEYDRLMKEQQPLADEAMFS